MFDLMSAELETGYVCPQCHEQLAFDDEHSELWWCKRCESIYEPWEVEERNKIYE